MRSAIVARPHSHDTCLPVQWTGMGYNNYTQHMYVIGLQRLFRVGTCAGRGRAGLYAALVACLLAAVPALAQGQGTTPDCEPGPVDFDAEGRLLTHADKIELMDRAFYDSLERFEECQTDGGARQAGGGAGQAGGGAGQAGSGAGQAGSGVSESDGEDGGSAADQAGIDGSGSAGESAESAYADDQGADDSAFIESVGARGIQGTEAPVPGEVTPGESADAGTEAAMSASGSGKVPEDIPDVDNDDAVAKQIRLAAMTETDPAIKARLWNEYRRYKGLPAKPGPGEEVAADGAATE